jgi:hypothetical protein
MVQFTFSVKKYKIIWEKWKVLEKRNSGHDVIFFLVERTESIFVTSNILFNLLRINTLYLTYYVVSIIYSNNYIVSIDRKGRTYCYNPSVHLDWC